MLLNSWPRLKPPMCPHPEQDLAHKSTVFRGCRYHVGIPFIQKGSKTGTKTKDILSLFNHPTRYSTHKERGRGSLKEKKKSLFSLQESGQSLCATETGERRGKGFFVIFFNSPGFALQIVGLINELCG